MKNIFRLLLLLCIGLPFAQLFAQAPQGMNYQAVARDASGNIYASHAISVRISITNGSGGSTLYQETHATTTNQFGLFTLNVGSGTPVSGTFSGINWSGTSPWMKIEYDPNGGSSYTNMGTSELLSVPYSLYAASAGNISGTTNQVIKFTGPNSGGNSLLYDDGTNVSIGTTSPTSSFHVEKSGTPYAIGYPTSIMGQAANNGFGVVGTDGAPALFSIFPVGIYGHANSSEGVFGTSTDFEGVLGRSETSSGVYGFTFTGTSAVVGYNNNVAVSTNGVYGSGSNGLYGYGTNSGVLGTANATIAPGVSYTNIGMGYSEIPAVYGTSDGAEPTLGMDMGVGGTSYNSGSFWNIGVYGEAANSLSAYNYGLYGRATGTGTTDLAGCFDGNSKVFGNLDVTGTLTATTKSFKIDHPLDPANKYLVYACPESPEMLNVYSGNATTNAQGIAVILLPDHFDAMNKDARYQLTVIGTFAQAVVKEKENNNQFTIQTDKPNVEVSWQVTGVRNDKWAQANPIRNEQEKTGIEKGKYIHPEVYGLGTELKITANPPVAASAPVSPNAFEQQKASRAKSKTGPNIQSLNK